ncbi:GumC family protein [Marimonas sp. MJW-29]|uniref:GumC family protein n=1 Tax=Sulfitobacter sediminis TaxID=3234186 RepID=A0ABV3RJ20_9RHOB
MADFLDMVRRRLGLILAVTILGCIGSVFFALSQAHEYESSEVIQIEQPKISDELAQSTVESSAARRLQLIEQQLMARGNLLALMEEFDIYTNLPGLRPTEKVDLLRRSITITGVAAAREGFADDGAISVLTITARMDSPEKARAVAHALADATRELAAKQREEQTRETLAFFQNQERTLLDEIARVEAELATFRSENDISIEGSLEFRRSELSSLNDALLELDREIIAAQLELQSLDRSGNTRAATIERQQEELTRLLDSLTTQRQLLQDRRAALSASIETTPEVERTLADFDRRLDQLRDQLEEVSERRTAAEVGFSVESAARGERLMTLEEANLPDYPVTTSRKLMVAAGTVASILLGLGIAFLLELRRPVIRTARQMQRETGLMPVVSIPDTTTEKSRKSRNSRWEERREAGLQGRAARLARNGGSTGR